MNSARGFTLVEMIVVIVITGIIGAAVAMFIRRPVEGYIDAVRRAELSDIADTALRRMTRDLRSALPNSVRVTGGYIEFLQTSGGGRYRAELDSGGGGNMLDFTTTDSQFDVIGPAPDFASGVTRHIVVYNLNSDADPASTANAYVGDNRADLQGIAGSTVTLTAGKQFPFASPGKRFQVVQYPVTYACAGGELRRYWDYEINVNQPMPAAGGATPPTGTNTRQALLATNVTDCDFSYVVMSGSTQRTGVVALSLEVSQSGERVRLFQQAHVSNVP